MDYYFTIFSFALVCYLISQVSEMTKKLNDIEKLLDRKGNWNGNERNNI